MKQVARLVACLFVGAFFSVTVSAEEVGFAGITVGQTSCKEMYDKAVEAKAIKGEPFNSAITNGPGIRLSVKAFGYDFVRSGFVLCGEDKVVDAIIITIPKSSAAEIASILGNKYEQKKYNLPRLGGGEALYASSTGNSEALVSYQHVSFTADVTLYTKEFEQTYAAYTTSLAEEKRKEKESAF